MLPTSGLGFGGASSGQRGNAPPNGQRTLLPDNQPVLANRTRCLT